MLRRAFALVLVCGLTACGKAPINPLTSGFRVDDTALDFGRVPEGTSPVKNVTVVNTGEGELTVDVATPDPFSAPPTLDLPGGTSVDLPVTFHAGTVLAMGTLVVSQGDAGFTVALSGLGVHPLTCVSAIPCHDSHYDFDSDRCVDTVSADGVLCTPTSTCLDQGQCLAGVCIGVPRSCDDMNLCTVDGCAEGLGCVNSPVACPPPADPCRVATCDPNHGCGDGPAPVGTVCGSVDCMRANICDPFGACQNVATPDGFPCSPPTPCQAQGTCTQGSCIRPPATFLLPELGLPLGGAPPSGRPMLLSFAGELFGEVCALPLDVPDAGDAGDPSDAGDGGDPADAGDGGAPLDGGDGGAGADAGPASDGGTCALFSYTNNGFERFTAKFPDTRERAFVHVSNLGAALLAPATASSQPALELRSLGDGALRWRAAFSGAVLPGGVAAASNSNPWVLWADDAGGTQLCEVIDGGIVPRVALDGSVQLLALDEQNGAWASNPLTGLGARLIATDAGPAQNFGWLSAPDASTFTLATTAFSSVFGNRQLFGPDAGLVTTLDWTDDAGEPLRVQERFTLMSSQRVVIFYKQCPQPLTSCTSEQDDLRQRSFLLPTGEVVDDVRLAPIGTDTRVVEAGLLDIPGFPPGTLVLVQSYSDAGDNAFLRLVVGGSTDLSCPLQPGTEVAGATFGGDFLWVYDRRDGGPYQLESYSLAGADVSVAGWPVADGIAGQRRAQ